MYTCIRCHYKTKQKCHLVRHLSNISPCAETHNNTPCNVLIEQLHNNDKRFVCPCGSKFTFASGLSRHKATCTHSIDEANRQNEMQEKIASLEARLRQVEQTPTQSGINGNNNHNNTVNITNNTTVNIINRRNFGNEDADYIKNDHQFLQACISNRNVAPIIEGIWCDKDHPQNHNVRIRNVNRGIMEKYDDNKWLQVDQDTLLEDLLNRGYHILKVYVRKNKEDVLEDCCDDEEEEYDTIMKWLDNDRCNTNDVKIAKKNLIIIFRNNKTMLLGQD